MKNVMYYLATRGLTVMDFYSIQYTYCNLGSWNRLLLLLPEIHLKPIELLTK